MFSWLLPGANQVYIKRRLGGQGLVGEVVFAIPIQVAVRAHGEEGARGRRGGLLLRRQSGQVLGEVPVVSADAGVHQLALADFGHQLLGANGGVKLLVAPVSDGVGQVVGARRLLDALTQFYLVDVARQKLGFD